jgi:hypothetical protein
VNESDIRIRLSQRCEYGGALGIHSQDVEHRAENPAAGIGAKARLLSLEPPCSEKQGFLTSGEKIVAPSVDGGDSESLGCHFEKPKVLDDEMILMGDWKRHG